MASSTVRVFLSYPHSYAQAAEAIRSRLRYPGPRYETGTPRLAVGNQIEIWTDARIEPGADWRKAVAGAIARCEVFVALIPPATSRSEEVRNECQQALSQRKRIVPICLEDRVDADNLAYYGLQHVQALTYNPANPFAASKHLEPLSRVLHDPKTPSLGERLLYIFRSL